MEGASTLLPGLAWLVLASLTLLTAVLTVTSRSPLRGACALLGHIVALSLLFLALSAEFLAVLQILVYGGATVVLFIFVMMLLGGEALPPPLAPRPRWAVALFAAAGVSLAVTMAGAFVFAALPARPDTPAGFGTVASVGGSLFREHFVAFELVGILLTTAMVSAIAITRSRGWHEVPAASQASAAGGNGGGGGEPANAKAWVGRQPG